VPTAILGRIGFIKFRKEWAGFMSNQNFNLKIRVKGNFGSVFQTGTHIGSLQMVLLAWQRHVLGTHKANRVSIEIDGWDIEKLIELLNDRPPFQDLRIDQLPFAKRTKNALKGAGYTTEAGLMEQYLQDPAELEELRNIGRKGYKDIINYLESKI